MSPEPELEPDPAEASDAEAHTRRDAVRLGLKSLATAVAAGSLAACGGKNRPHGTYTPVVGITPPDDGTGTLAPLTRLPAESAAIVDVDGEALALTRAPDGAVHAFDATCPHQDCVVVVSRGLLHCPCHDTDFDPATGTHLRGPAPTDLQPRAVTVIDGMITLGDG